MNTEYKAPNTNDGNWDSYPFAVEGVNFVSKIKQGSEFWLRLQFVPAEAFAKLNQGAVSEMLGNPNSYTREQILERLAEVNHGGTQAIIELAS